MDGTLTASLKCFFSGLSPKCVQLLSVVQILRTDHLILYNFNSLCYQVPFVNNKRKPSLCGNTFALLLPWELSLFIFPKIENMCFGL